jgi:hypothetical protein
VMRGESLRRVVTGFRTFLAAARRANAG